MAMTYQNFASLGVNLNRQKYGPLDISNVFTSAADLQYYLTKGAHTEGVSEYWYKNANEKVVPYPYEGQVLATVIDGVVNVYALSLDAEGNFQTQEIAAKIEVDGKTIVKDADGKLSIVAPANPDSAKTYNFAYANGVYSWVEVDTATAAGQAQSIKSLQERATALEEAVNGKGEGDAHVAGLTEKVTAITESIGDVTEGSTVAEMISAAEQAAKDYADGLAGNYDASGAAATAEQNAKAYADSLAVNYDAAGSASAAEAAAKAYADGLAGNYDAAGAASTALESAKTYTDEQITGLDVVIEKKDDVEHIVIKNAAGTEVASVDASRFVQDSFLNDVAYDATSGKITFTWTMGDGSTKTDEVAVADFVQTYTAGNGLTLSDNEFAIDTAVVATVEELNRVKETAEAAQTAQEVSDAITAKIAAENLSQYAKAADITEGYYSKTQIDNKGYAVATEVADAYLTKAAFETHEQDITNELLAYAKTTDVNAELAKKIESGSIAHSSDTLAEGVTVEGTALKIVVDTYTKEETLAKIQEVLDRINDNSESAASVASKLDSHIETATARFGQIDTKNGEQDTAIAAAQAQADKGVADAAKVAEDLAAANVNIGNNAREIETVKGTITTVNETQSGKITALENKDIELAGQISGLNTTVSGHTTTITEQGTAIAALQNRDIELTTLITSNTNKFADYYTSTQVDTKISEVAAEIDAIDLTPYAKLSDVNSEVARIDTAIATKAEAEAVYTKEEADAAFMTQDEVDARIDALIVASDPDGDGNVITNIQNLVEYVENNAGSIAGLITSVGVNTTAIATNTENIAGLQTAVNDLDVAVKAIVQPQESSEISVADNGELGIKEVNVNKLVQTEGDVLILNGGNA